MIRSILAPTKTSLTLSVLMSAVLLAAAVPGLRADTTPQNEPALPSENSAAVPDYAREKRLDNEIRDAIFDGEVVDLYDGTEDFMAIQTDADDAKGAAIILHGRGFHPDWADTINPLRVGLAEQGWTTLSVQLPVLEKQAKYYDYVPLFPNANLRITAALEHLKEQDISTVVLIAHSCGGHMAMDWVRKHGETGIDAFVGLGLGATDYRQFMAEPFPLDKLTVPVFDVYGENEYPAVIKMAPERLKLMQAGGNAKSEQAVLPGADHYFKEKGDELTELVSAWLEKL
ncbi:MAG: Unknown protein [uncultured Thiotrichaceae bacterium]|uniref:DUF3530 family protein n=1 Tax=uncultured Thiotrichaceae bacterium TaxID=298394 RepID=A0A6S6T7Z4_9GAMM|nr:MAG: Unknown protein [uncultured Thiotrichaceae bacterium]